MAGETKSGGEQGGRGGTEGGGRKTMKGQMEVKTEEGEERWSYSGGGGRGGQRWWLLWFHVRLEGLPDDRGHL